MSLPIRDDVARQVTVTVAELLIAEPSALAPNTDLRTVRSFSSFRAITILERLEQRLAVEIPADQLTAERLCSIAALTDMFVQALAERRVATS